MFIILILTSGGSSPGGSSGGMADMMALAGLTGSSTNMGGGASGGLNSAALMASGALGVKPKVTDMTNMFNAQALAGVGGGLAGLQNLDFAKLQALDRAGVIDIGDLTPGGLAAANAHFAG